MFGFPVYPRSCAGGWRSVGARWPRCQTFAAAVAVTGSPGSAEFGAFPNAGSSAAGLRKRGQQKALDGARQQPQSAGGCCVRMIN